MRRTWFACFLALGTSLAASGAGAEERLGKRGSIFIQGGSSFAAALTLPQPQPGEFTASPWQYSASLRPAGDVFLGHGLSVGAATAFHGSDSVAWAAIAPRVGLLIPIDDEWLSVWARFGAELEWQLSSNPAPSLALQAAVPFIFEPATHFVLGIGPTFGHRLANGDASGATSFGLTTIIGGWF